jgi:hypothetical protein
MGHGAGGRHRRAHRAEAAALMQAKAARRRGPADASDSFFGETASLGAARSAHGAPPGRPRPPSMPDLAPPASRRRPSWLMLALVGGGALLLGVILVLVLVLR